MRIGVGISGGVDSALAASLLKAQGADVVAYTMVLTSEDILPAARQVAEKLDIPFHIVDLRQEFARQVLDYFVDEYAVGRTPSPCCRCNPRIKFGALWERMQADGCEKMATGHYARLTRDNGDLQLRRALDLNKDQSYFLAQVPKERFEYVLFPLGEYCKSQVKELGEALGLVPKQQKESQDLCFVADGEQAKFVLSRYPELGRQGDIVAADGRKLGRHDGAFQFTVGQRRGLKLGGGPWYVSQVRMADNSLLVAHEPVMQEQPLVLEQMNWLANPTGELLAQTRYKMTSRQARVSSNSDGTCLLQFMEPAPAVPPGQLAVFYRQDQVVGSGWIR